MIFAKKKVIENEQISAEEQKIRAYTQNEYNEVKSYVSIIEQKIHDFNETQVAKKIDIQQEDNLDTNTLIQKYNELVENFNIAKQRLKDGTENPIGNLTNLCLYSSKIIDGEDNFTLPFTNPLYKNGDRKTDPIKKVKIEPLTGEDAQDFREWFSNISTTGELIGNILTSESPILKTGGFLTSKDFIKIVHNILQKKLKFKNKANNWENVYDNIDHIVKENPVSLQPLEQHIHVFFSNCCPHFGLFCENIKTNIYYQTMMQNRLLEEVEQSQNQDTNFSQAMQKLNKLL
jgi:hypothetical protein